MTEIATSTARFQTDQKIVIYNTTDEQLDGQVCVVLGRHAILAGSDFYIIMLEHPRPNSEGEMVKAISLTEHCMRPA
jgi:hypothetical protein